jgi:hypothetical protein
MKTEHWLALVAVGIIIFAFLKNGMSFNGLTAQRGTFGTSTTPVDHYYD